MTGTTFARAAAPVRGRHADDRRRPSDWPPRHDYLGAWAWTTSRRTSANSSAAALDGLATVAGLRIIGPAVAGRPRRADRRSSSPACTRTTSAQLLDDEGIAVRAGHHCARPLHAVRNTGDHAGVVRGVHDHRRDRRAGARHRAVREVFGCVSRATGPDVPADHPGPLQAPAAPRAARAVRRRGAPRQPDLRRRGDAAGGALTTAIDRRPRWDGEGCSISQASTSVMSELVVGRAVGEAMKTAAAFLEMVSARRRRSTTTRRCSATRSRSRASRSTRRG